MLNHKFATFADFGRSLPNSGDPVAQHRPVLDSRGWKVFSKKSNYLFNQYNEENYLSNYCPAGTLLCNGKGRVGVIDKNTGSLKKSLSLLRILKEITYCKYASVTHVPFTTLGITFRLSVPRRNNPKRAKSYARSRAGSAKKRLRKEGHLF